LIPLEDALTAGSAVVRFLGSRSLADYEGDPMLRSAVERQLMIVGEALNRTLRAAPELVNRIPEAPEAIGFRKLLAHGYDEVVDRLVFNLAHERLPLLIDRVRAILDESDKT
jgi:uncharacterized protein with HEPN domain